MGSSVVVTLALYTMLGVRQWFSKGQVAFLRQLHPCVVVIYIYIYISVAGQGQSGYNFC